MTLCGAVASCHGEPGGEHKPGAVRGGYCDPWRVEYVPLFLEPGLLEPALEGAGIADASRPGAVGGSDVRAAR